MRVYHPNADAVRDTVDDVDGAVTLGRETYSVADDDTLEVPEAEARTLARLYDVALSDIRVDGDGDGGDGDDTADDEGEICGADLSSGGTCDRLASECPYHDTGGE